MASGLAQRIVRLLSDGRSRTAREIGRSLGETRKDVNSVLRSELRAQVIQSSNYRWSLGTAESKQQTEKTQKHLLANIASYYLDCLSLDEDTGYSVFASSKGQPQYAATPDIEIDDEQFTVQLNQDSGSLFRSSRQSRFRQQAYFGYPVRLRHHRARSGWSGFFVEPVFVYPIDDSNQGSSSLHFGSADFPMLNPGVVRAFAEEGGVSLMGEIAQLSEELGLGTVSEGAPSIDDLVDKLREVRPQWDWKEASDPEQIKNSKRIDEIGEPGIYNQAVIFTGERSPYTQGLETELGSLKQVDESAYKDTVLKYWLGDGSQRQSETREVLPLIEILPLNTEQRAAVESALVNDVTVITGPPGTGKSQVVSSIVTNAAWHGQRVLVASKNNKAVDVVEVRVNSLGPRPVLLRTGANEYQYKLAEYIDTLLSATTTSADRQRYAEASEVLNRLEEREEQLNRHVGAVVELRNEVDHYDRLVDSIKALRPIEFIDFARTACSSKLNDEIGFAEKAIRLCDRSRANGFARLFWPFLRGKRQSAAGALFASVKTTKDVPGIQVPTVTLTESTVASWNDWLDEVRAAADDISTVQKYTEVLAKLKSCMPLERVASEKLNLVEQKAKLSSEVWEAWLRLQPANLTAIQRQVLANYVAALKLVIAARDVDEKPAGSLLRQIQQLYPQVAEVMNSWAVTSLSARGRIPFEPGFYDLVVFDEASQCDIASAIPLLYRAKRAVVIGDPNQLAHISRITAAQDRQLLFKHELSDRPVFSFSANSLFGLGQSAAGSVVSLRDHHRSHADIIGFSNRLFYGGDLRIATPYNRLRRPAPDYPAVRWINVQGRTRRPSGGSAVNEQEAEVVLAELRRLLLDQEYKGSVGVVSPFRSQAERIREMAHRDAKLAPKLAAADFESDTADRFQGDERDVILFSPVISSGASDGAVRFLNRERNRFNVAVSRARAALVVVGDELLARTGEVEYLKALADYVDQLGSNTAPTAEPHTDFGPEYPASVDQERVSEWEKVLYRALYHAGIRAVPQWPVEQYMLDFAVFPSGSERKLNIEVDGERFHREWNGELARRDQLRNQRMIELGWDVMRFWVYEVRDDLDRCVGLVNDWIEGKYRPQNRLVFDN
jgi:very-short-patch-repair endonuclease